MTNSVQSPAIVSFSVKDFEENDRNPISKIVKEYGVVYVTSITRDGCSGCEEQKPLFRDLATRLAESYDHKISFNNVHVRYANAQDNESVRAKMIFGHGSYPTYMIHIKSHYGSLEHYRAAYPRMIDLEQQAINAMELATFYKEESIRTKD